MKVRSLIAHSILIYTQLSDFALCKKLSEYNSCAEITDEKEKLKKEDNPDEEALKALEKTERLCLNKEDVKQTMGVFLSVLGIICLVGLCCLCLAPNSTRLNSKRMWMEIKQSEEKEELYNEAGEAYEKRRDDVRKRRKEEKQKELKRTQRLVENAGEGMNKSAKSPMLLKLEKSIKERVKKRANLDIED